MCSKESKTTYLPHIVQTGCHPTQTEGRLSWVIATSTGLGMLCPTSRGQVTASLGMQVGKAFWCAGGEMESRETRRQNQATQFSCLQVYGWGCPPPILQIWELLLAPHFPNLTLHTLDP